MSETNWEKMKKERHSVSLDVKMQVIRRYRKGERSSAIARHLGLPPTTVRTILKNAEEIVRKAQYATAYSAFNITRQRSDIMEKMEKLLSVWLEDLYSQNIPVNYPQIRLKALDLYDSIKSEGEWSVAANENFSASRGWFHRFQVRYEFKYVNVQDDARDEEAMQDEVAAQGDAVVESEAANAHIEWASSYAQTLLQIVEEESYDVRQVFNVVQTGLYWKKMPSKTHISINEKNSPCYEDSREHLTLLLGGNANGDKKLKPLVMYHHTNPNAVKCDSMSHLPVIWKFEQVPFITNKIFREWFIEYLIPELKLYCKQKNLPFKILLLLDYAKSSAIDFDGLCSNIRIVFLPQHIAPLIQPVDHGVVAYFKAYYLRIMLKRLIYAVKVKGTTVRNFWENFTIRDTLYMIVEAWNELTDVFMNSVWKNVYPAAVLNWREEMELEMPDVHGELVCLAREVFSDVDEENVKELLKSHSTPLTNEEFIESCNETFKEEASKDSVSTKENGLTLDKLQYIFSLADKLIRSIENCDNNSDRSAKVTQAIRDSLSCYRKIYDSQVSDRMNIKFEMEPVVDIKVDELKSEELVREEP